jgi:hypothetical protein
MDDANALEPAMALWLLAASLKLFSDSDKAVRNLARFRWVSG